MVERSDSLIDILILQLRKTILTHMKWKRANIKNTDNDQSEKLPQTKFKLIEFKNAFKKKID
jgi:hypothetical protein